MKIKIAIIGCGNIGLKRINAINELSDISIVNSLVGNPLKDTKCYAKKFSKIYGLNYFTDWNLLFKRKIDAVILCTPSNLSFKIGMKIIQNKINLLIEKPLGVNSIQARKLYKASIKHQVVLKTGYNLRFDNGVKEIKNILKKKKIGEIYFSKIEYVNGAARSNTNGLGSLLDLGSHIVNLFQFLFPGNIKVKYSENTSNEYMKEDNGYMSLNINNINCLGHHSFVRWKNNFSLEIFGKKGFVILNSLPKWGSQILTIGKRKYPSGKPKLRFIYLKNKDLSWKNELRYFFNLIKKKDYSLNREGLDTMSIIDRCQKSDVKFKRNY